MKVALNLPRSDQTMIFEVDLSLEGLEKDLFNSPEKPHFSGSFQHCTAVEDLRYIKSVSDKYFPFFVDSLNQFHRQDLSLRVWKVLIGHWYLEFAKALFCRVEIVQRLAEEENLRSCEITISPDKPLSETSSSHLTGQCMDHMWNEQLFAEICLTTNLIPTKKLRFRETNAAEATPRIKFAARKESREKGLLRLLLNLYSPFKWRRSRPLFFYTGMSRWEHSKLFLMSGGLPLVFKEPKTFNFKADTTLRERLTQDLLKKNLELEDKSPAFEQCLQALFFKCLPRNFLEAFQKNFLLADSNLYPQNPTYIFMANGFWIDSLSFYVAKKILIGIPFLVGQHGANYGVSKTEMMFPVEEETADIFFTWGQRNSLCSNTFAGFNWKIPLVKKSVSATPKIIILTRPPWPSKEHFSITPWYREYVDNVVALVQAIDERYRGSVVIRMHPSGAPELEKKVWSQFLPDINLDDSNQFEIGKIGDGGVLVFTYLSTLFYEVLCSQPSLNIVGSWNYIRDDVRDQHVETFNELHAAGILFESSSDAANHVSGLMRGTVQHPTAVREKAISRFNATLNKRGSQSSAAGELLRNIRCALTSTGFETR